MRPERAIVKKAIADAGGNLSRAAASLGCTRQTLYTWVYQLGLDRFAGVRMDRRHELDARDRMDRRGGKRDLRRSSATEAHGKFTVYSGEVEAPTLPVVATASMSTAIPITASVKLPEDLWKRVKIEAIREGVTVSEFVRRMLEANLAHPMAVETPTRRRARKAAGGAPQDEGGAE